MRTKMKKPLQEQFKRIGGKLNEMESSDMRLQSNIDDRWSSSQDMIDDTTQWIEAATAAGGSETLEDFERAVQEIQDFITDLDRRNHGR